MNAASLLRCLSLKNVHVLLTKSIEDPAASVPAAQKVQRRTLVLLLSVRDRNFRSQRLKHSHFSVALYWSNGLHKVAFCLVSTIHLMGHSRGASCVSSLSRLAVLVNLTTSNLRDASTIRTAKLLATSPLPDDSTVASKKWSKPP